VTDIEKIDALVRYRLAQAEEALVNESSGISACPRGCPSHGPRERRPIASNMSNFACDDRSTASDATV
jgi:hypothetical protein